MKFFLFISILFIIFSCTTTKYKYYEFARNTYYPGAFEIFFVTHKNNQLVHDKVYYNKWKSHIPFEGKYVNMEHRGTDHGTPHDYDIHVPIVLYGEKYVKTGASNRLVHLQDIVPTISKVLNIESPSYSTGKVLEEALNPFQKLPKAVLLIVLDQVGWRYLMDHLEKAPFIDRVLKTGFVYKNALINFTPSSTGVAHAVIGTGVLPKYSGIFDNSLFLNSIYKRVPIYGRYENSIIFQLRQPTLVDLWGVISENRAEIIVYSSAIRASVGLGGHGSAFRDGSKGFVFWYDDSEDKFDTYSQFFTLPQGVERKNFSNYMHFNEDFEYWQMQECDYEGKTSFQCLMGSPAFMKMEGDMLAQVIKTNKNIGKDDITDLIFINFKGTDYCGHYLGSESLECGETLSEASKQIEIIYNYLNQVTDSDFLFVLTSDHGVAPLVEVSGGSFLLARNLNDELNNYFNKNKSKIKPINSIYKTYLSVNIQELKANGFKLEDVKNYLKNYKVDNKLFFEEVITYKELER